MLSIQKRHKKITVSGWIAIACFIAAAIVGAIFIWKNFPTNEPPVAIPTASPTESASAPTATSFMTEASTPFPTVSPTIKPTEMPVPTETPTTEVFIFKDGSLWKDAFILHSTDGKQFQAVALASMPLGLELKAPIGGHVFIIDPGWDVEVLVIAEDENWTLENPVGCSIAFAAKGFDLLVEDEVSEGETFASIRENDEIGAEYYAEKVVLIIGSTDNQMKPVDPSITDAEAYLRAIIKATE